MSKPSSTRPGLVSLQKQRCGVSSIAANHLQNRYIKQFPCPSVSSYPTAIPTCTTAGHPSTHQSIHNPDSRKSKPTNATMSPRDPIITRSKSAQARANAATATAAATKSTTPPQTITMTKPERTTPTITAPPARTLPISIISTSEIHPHPETHMGTMAPPTPTPTPAPTLPISIISTSSEIHPYPETLLEGATATPTRVLAPIATPTPSTIQPLIEVATIAAHHFSPSWQMPEFEVVVFTVTALCLVWVCRLAWRSLRGGRGFRRSRAD